MSLARTIILTRDEAGCAASLLAWQPIFKGHDFLMAPSRLVVPVEISKSAKGQIDDDQAGSVIFTSANGVKYSSGIATKNAYCVGEKTARSARARGFEIMGVAGTAHELVGILAKLKPQRFIWISGRVFTIDFTREKSLSRHQIEHKICYDVKHRDWSADEVSRIHEAQNPLFPVFSKASAVSLVANFGQLTSQFCGEMLPISSDVAGIFPSNDQFMIANLPKQPNFTSMTASLLDFLEAPAK